jgi:hypothetical protein
MRLITIALFTTSYLAAASAAAAPPQFAVVPHGLGAAGSVSQSAAASNSAAHAAQAAASAAAVNSAAVANAAANASANGAAHAAAAAARAAAYSALAASAAANSVVAVRAASNASANGAAHAAANAAAANAAGAIAGGPAGPAGKGVPPGLADKGGAPPGQADKGGRAPVLAQDGGSSSAPAPTAPAPLAQGGAPSGVGDAPPAPAQDSGAVIVVQTVLVPSAQDGVQPVIFVPTAGDPAQTLSQASADPPPAPDSGAAGGVGSSSEQRQRVMAALGSGLLEYSRTGAIVRKGEILALSPSAASLAIADRLGYVVVEQLPLRDLGLNAVVLRAPPNMSADDALRQLQAADPTGGYSLNPIYAMTGQLAPGARTAESGPAPRPARGDAVAAVGLIDTGVFVQHPALASIRLEQQGFAPGGLTPAKHGTAVASITAGQAGAFHGVAPGSRIYVADVYGKTGAGGSASAVAEGIDWLVRRGAPVINISLVGPANTLMEAAVQAAIRKGVIVVAAVGNDGPNSPPLYPAAYRGVLAVTGVDQKDHILFEAVRATPVAFAAPGADIFAADGVGGFAKVRGTSFASPIVAARLALAHRRLDAKDAAAAIQKLKRAAKAPADAAFGFGIVGEDARLALRPGLWQLTTADAEGSGRSKE